MGNKECCPGSELNSSFLIPFPIPDSTFQIPEFSFPGHPPFVSLFRQSHCDINGLFTFLEEIIHGSPGALAIHL